MNILSDNFKFVDLFCGIGGFHLAMSSLGGECVFSSDYDKFAQITYEANFGYKPFGDITQIDAREIPAHDVLCAGFPCQPFSQAGYKKGFSETKEARGNMFFIIRDIVKAKRPKAIFLENVKNLINHDDGKTFAIIKQTIEDELEYDFYWQVVKACDYGLPQHRPRVYMICVDKALRLKNKFIFPSKLPLKYSLSQIFNGDCEKNIGFTLRVGGRGSKINDKRNWEFYLVNGEVKRLGIKEGKMMMGFPDDFIFPVSETQTMKQLGNSVAVDAIKEVGGALIDFLKSNQNYIENNMLSLPLFRNDFELII
jgi:DNA (cytosine-5)-methyltransferase 1